MMSSLIQLSVHRDRWGDYTVYLHPKDSSKVPSRADLEDEFTSMVKAVDAAIARATAIRLENGWAADNDSLMIHPIQLASYPCDLSDQSLAELRQWAVEHDEKLPKCDHCGEIIGRETYTNSESEWTGFKFCSEYCAEMNMSHEEEDDDDD